MPDNMLKALNKVSPRVNDEMRTRNLRDSRYEQTPVSRSPSVKPGNYEPLEETNDLMEIIDSRIDTFRSDVVIGGDTESIMPHNSDNRAIITGNTAIVIDVDVHDRSINSWPLFSQRYEKPKNKQIFTQINDSECGHSR